jgi:FHA domain
MPTCPAGHDSADAEFCDVCGRALDGPTPTPPPPAATPDSPCQSCGTPLSGRFCEACGHDSLAEPPVHPARPPDSRVEEVPPVRMPGVTGWVATVHADQEYYETVMAAEGPDAGGITFPPFCPDRHFPLEGKQVSIGRRSRSRGINPDIDLTGPPEDPGVSHLHALLIAQEDGSWAIVDLDSANGLAVNDEPEPLRPNTPRVLVDGDRVYLGAWTRITMRAT